MDTKERLTCIRARCVELLAIAEKRTKGNDSKFIASCAGAAEAGWRSTIAAIDGILANPVTFSECSDMEQRIISAWSDELI